jgi:hypothetical protein
MSLPYFYFYFLTALKNEKKKKNKRRGGRTISHPQGPKRKNKIFF